MQDSLRGFGIALLAIWTILCIAAVLFSQQQNIPTSVVVSVLPALLLEASMYFACGSAVVRRRLEAMQRRAIAAGLLAAGAAPYLFYSIASGVFSPLTLAIVCAMVAVAALWYLVLPTGMLTDSVFLVLMAAPVLFRVFQMLYADPYPKLDASILGTAMWTRTGIIAVLVIRRLEGVGFGFVPSKRDWLVGLRNYVFFVPIGLGLALLVGFVKLRPEPQNWALGLGTFLGIFFFVAASEEFFFRGFLQQLIERATQSQTTAIIIASVLFGLVHLGFRRQFPNWQFAVLAAVAGLFYGRAYVKTGSIRASMVTHALVVTTWRVFFV